MNFTPAYNQKMSETPIPPSRPPDRYRHGNLRNAALDEAAALVAQRGGADFSLREIAERLGVRHAALYRHYASREALISTLAARGFSTMQQRFEAATSLATGDAEACLAGLKDAYVAMAREEPGAYRVMFSNITLPDPDRSAAAEACFDMLVSAFAAAQAAGLARADIATRHLASVNWAALHGLAMLLIDRRLEDQDALMAAFASVLEAGWMLKPRP
jgi:AcrR family transcriptional regulator